MKIARTFLAVALLALGVSAHSQEHTQRTWTVNVPFDFTVRHTSLAAGRYTVQQSGPVVVMTSANGKSANVLTNKECNPKPSAYSALVFEHANGEYALAQVKNIGSETELYAVVSKHAPKGLEASNRAELVEVMAVGTR